MTIDDVEAVIWQVSTVTGEDGKPRRLLAPLAVDEILAAVSAFGKARAREAREPGEPAPRKPPSVHYAPGGDRPACLPYDALAGRGKALTADPSLVTCGHCVKTPAWKQASGIEGLDAYVTGGAL